MITSGSKLSALEGPNPQQLTPPRKTERTIFGFLFLILDLSLVFSELWDLGNIYKNMMCNKIRNSDF